MHCRKIYLLQAFLLLWPLPFALGQTLESTTLPLLVIDSKGQEIPDEPKVDVDLKIIHNQDGTNRPSDPGNEYEGNAGFEIRGSYSASLPQKPYSFETRDDLGENLNVELLDMPRENDWILIANYNDKVFMRNILSFHLFRKMGHYAPRAHLCEMVLNGDYQGIYVLTEKIKRDKYRVDIAKLDADDNAGDSLTGGYIFMVDYPDGASWLSAYHNPGYPDAPVYFLPGYPKVKDITNEQYAYLKDMVSEFEDVLWGDQFMDPSLGYRSYIDVNSFIDYFLVSELSRNMDGYKKSRRFFKDKDSKDPLIYAGPVWDFDWAYKDQEYTMLNGEGWQYSFTGPSDVKPPGWYYRLLEDPWFAGQLKCRFLELQQNLLSYQYLNNYIDSVAVLVEVAQQRHYEKWPILGRNVGTPELGSQPQSYDGEVDKFKQWIMERLVWLHYNMPGECVVSEAENSLASGPGLRLYPNPATDFLVVESDLAFSEIRIYDASGKVVYTEHCGKATFRRIAVDQWSGLFILEVTGTGGTITRERFISR
ncbi:MAG: CotH kinase family protein [Bacteroidota bacterium]